MRNSLSTLCNKEVLGSLYYDSSRKLEIRLKTWEKYGTNPTPFVDWILNQLPELRSGRARFLDVGCGTGLLLAHAKRSNKLLDIHGVDTSLAMVKATRSVVGARAGKNIRLAGIEKLPYPDNSFDVVSATHVLYHVKDIPKGLRELKRVTKPGGIIFISTSDYKLDRGLNRLHYAALTKFRFPFFMKDRRAYLRFTPALAKTALRKISKSIQELHYVNDACFRSVRPCLDYYQSAMMYRQSRGLDDSRIKAGQWESLAQFVERGVRRAITRRASFVQPGRVVAFKFRKNA